MKKKKRGHRLLVCGGRKFSNRKLVFETLDKYDRSTILIHGAAPGADSIAHEYAIQKRWAIFMFPAQWDIFDASAGPIRNQRMLDEADPDEILAFKGNVGTRDMVGRAKLAGVKVTKVGWE